MSGVNVSSTKLNSYVNEIISKAGDADNVTKSDVTSYVNKHSGELQELDIDINSALDEINDLIDKKKDGVVDGKNSNSKDLTNICEQLKTKYLSGVNISKQDYTATPQLKALDKALDDGILKDLYAQGYSKDEVFQIIQNVFPINLSKAGDKYEIPYGHDSEAKEIYKKFSDQFSLYSNSEIVALQQDIAANEKAIEANNAQMITLQNKIKASKEEVEAALKKAIEESKDIKEEQKDEAKKIVEQEINSYANSDGKMSYEDFESGLSKKLGALSSSGSFEIASIIAKFSQAQSEMDIIDGMISDVESLNNQNASLADDIEQAQSEMEDIASETVGKTDCEVEKCDPIGFNSGDTRYDFFVDKDSDEKLSNANEFLGAKKGWSEMTSLDSDGNGKISVDEMKDLHIVETAKDGSQTVKKASDLFKNNDFIDLNSYKSKNSDIGNGNTLLGTFGLTFKGNQIDDGYNTLDDMNWLSKNYDFSDSNETNFFEKSSVKGLDMASEIEQFKADFSALTNLSSQSDSSINDSLNEITSKITSSSLSSAKAKTSNIKFEDKDEKTQEKLEAKQAETQEAKEKEELEEQEKKKKIEE